MRVLPEDFQSHLETKCTTLCYCAAIERADGVIIGFTEHDRDIQFDGVRFASEDGCDLSSIINSVRATPDEADLFGVLRGEGLRDDDILNGKYQNAKLSIWRVNWENSDQRALLKYGTLGNLSKTQSGLGMEFLGLTASLDQTIGRLYQRECDACLGDDRCKVELSGSAFEYLATVILHDETNLTITAEEVFPAHWFSFGRIRFVDGSQQRAEYRIRSTSNKESTIIVQLEEKLPAYDFTNKTVLLTAGCDKRLETCRDKFSNFHNFRGFPHMPGDDFIIRIPTTGEVHNGGRRS